ncbi:MAG: hypothetical protein ACR2NM_09020 [Bythopirellula sp.]
MDANRPHLSHWLRPGWVRSALAVLLLGSVARAEQPPSVFDDEVFAKPFAEVDPANREVCEPGAAAFDSWESVVEDDASVYQEGPRLRPFDCVRHLGFRHSSTHGRHVGRGLPLEGTSWKNRPYHIDWFAGPLLSGDLVKNRVAQDNELFGGIRAGWDFDYYWGFEARFGWANPNVQFVEPQLVAQNGSYFVSDVDLVYYPWGDSKVRPYLLFGAGMARIDFVDDATINYNTTLFTTPFGGGVQFSQSPWLIWRMEVLDNLSYGADGVETMHNVSLTAGMEYRFGSRPQSYWPWRSSRKIW